MLLGGFTAEACPGRYGKIVKLGNEHCELVMARTQAEPPIREAITNYPAYEIKFGPKGGVWLERHDLEVRENEGEGYSGLAAVGADIDSHATFSNAKKLEGLEVWFVGTPKQILRHKQSSARKRIDARIAKVLSQRRPDGLKGYLALLI